MKNKELPFSEEHKRRMKKWKDKNSIPSSCPVCKSSRFLEFPVIQMLDRIDRQLSYPHISLLCLDCGHNLLFNAVIAGIVKLEELEDKSKWPLNEEVTNA